jgi:hypothetical protein
LQSEPLSTCGSGTPAPWQSRQFMLGTWPGGFGVAIRWLGVSLWQV